MASIFFSVRLYRIPQTLPERLTGTALACYLAVILKNHTQHLLYGLVLPDSPEPYTWLYEAPLGRDLSGDSDWPASLRIAIARMITEQYLAGEDMPKVVRTIPDERSGAST